MSKINARSPFYLNYQTPTEPSPEFTCAIANVKNFSVDQEGVITLPVLDFGKIHETTSSDAGYSDGKYATVTTNTTRTLTVTINIPPGFSNSGFLDCDVTTTQPKKVTTGTAPSCTGGPTKVGTIPNQTLSSGGGTATISLGSYFSGATNYSILNYHRSFVHMSISGSTLTLTASNTGGTRAVFVRARDSQSNTCTAVQAINVTVNVSASLDCTGANLQGGSISQSGAITKPKANGTVGTIKATSGGSAITSVSANSGSTAQNVTLFFDITVPAGYSNAGSTIECSKTFSQPGVSLPEFDCTQLTLTGGGVFTNGTIKQADTNRGTITKFSPLRFAKVSTETPRTITYFITPPSSGYTNSGGSDIQCTDTVTQPPDIPVCGTNSYFINQGAANSSEDTYCQTTLPTQAATLVKSTATSLLGATGKTVCYTNSAGQSTSFLNGGNKYHRIDTFRNYSQLDSSSGGFVLWRINDSGVITEVWRWECASGGNGTGLQY